MVNASKIIQVKASVEHLSKNAARNAYVQNVMYI